jgi:hypothetical protein
MSAQPPDAVAPQAASPPVTQLVIGSLALVLVGGILMAAQFPDPPLTAPVLLLAGSAVLFAGCIVLLTRQPVFPWGVLAQVGRWALLAYVVIAGMIEYSFIHNHATGTPLLVLTLMLVMFSLDVALSIGYSVARFAEPAQS